jgi:hypothetical protein
MIICDIKDCYWQPLCSCTLIRPEVHIIKKCQGYQEASKVATLGLDSNIVISVEEAKGHPKNE